VVVLNAAGLEERALVIAEEREDGILLRPAVAMPVEIYTERKAEFLLSTPWKRYESGEKVQMGVDGKNSSTAWVV